MTIDNGNRRARGEGTISYDADRDRWVGRIDLGRDATGSRLRPKVTAPTKREAAKKLRELVRANEANIDVSRRPQTVAQLAEDWLTKGTTRKAKSTLSRVRRRIDNHVLPGVGHFRIDKLQPEDVERWLAHEVATGHSLRTVQDYRGDLRQMLAWAMKRRLVTWNVAAIAELPADAAPPRPKYSFTVAEAERILVALEGDRLGPYFTVLLLLGLRPGEADALTWADVVDDEIVIDKALQRDDRGHPLLVGPTKTKQARTLSAPPLVIEALRVQKRNQAEERLLAGSVWSTKWPGHIFLNELGRPLNPPNNRRSFASLCARAGVPSLTVYELRHSAASLLVASGAQPFEVADLLGHGDLRMLERHYRHRLNPVVGTAHRLDGMLSRAQA